jgi:unconventional prefoldin RPB5 interactor 1
MSFQTKTELLLDSLYKKKFNIINNLEKERKTYDINKTTIETKLNSLSVIKQVVSKNNKIVNKINITTQETERKYNNYNDQLEQLYSRKDKEKDIINKQYDNEMRKIEEKKRMELEKIEYEIKKAEEKRDRLLDKIDFDSNKYETYLIKEKEKLEKKTEMIITDLSSNIIEPSDIIDEDKYPILTKSKETIKHLEQELEDLEKEILDKDSIRQLEQVERIKAAKEEYDRRVREEELAAEFERKKKSEELRLQREQEKQKDEERWEKQKLERIKEVEEHKEYTTKEEKAIIEKEKKSVWKRDILSQLEPDYKKIFNNCGNDRQAVCYTINDAIELKEYLDTFKTKVEKMMLLDEICWADNNIEYFNDSSIWEIWKDLPERIKMAVADLDTKDKQLKMIKKSKNIRS